YTVKADTPLLARSFLEADARAAIDELNRMGEEEGVLVSMNSSRLLVRKLSLLSDVETLRRFTDLACLLFDRLFELWQGESGIRFLEDAPPEPGPAVCQVCGGLLNTGTVVYCRRCRTPHHRDCWDYNEGCSTFACGERKFSKKY
ncbi:MAG: RING finger protein, partial [Planctomycetota bacterium]